MLIRCLLLSVWRKSRPAQFFPSPSTKYNWCWKIWGGEKTDRVGKKLTGYFFLPGKKMTSQFLPRGRNGPAWSFPGERLAGGKNWPLHRGRGRQPPGDKVLMSTEMSCHFIHLMQVLKKCLWSLILYNLFYDLIHVYSPGAAITIPRGQSFDVNRNFLSLRSSVASFKS